jgi:hypothetical protein
MLENMAHQHQVSEDEEQENEEQPENVSKFVYLIKLSSI